MDVNCMNWISLKQRMQLILKVASGIWGADCWKKKSYMLDVFLGVEPMAVNETNIYITRQMLSARKKNQTD